MDRHVHHCQDDLYPAYYPFGWVAQNEAGHAPWRHKTGAVGVTPAMQTSRPVTSPPNASRSRHYGTSGVVFNPITRLIEPLLATTQGNSPNLSELLQFATVGSGDWQPVPPRLDIGLEPRRSDEIQTPVKDRIHEAVSRNDTSSLNLRDQHFFGENSVIVGKIRRYDENRRSYGAWEDIRVSIDSNTGRGSRKIQLRRGGTLGVHKRLISQTTQLSLSKAMHKCKLYRQYSISKVFHEPRFHVLFSSMAKLDTNCGYFYHGVQVCRLGLQ